MIESSFLNSGRNDQVTPFIMTACACMIWTLFYQDVAFDGINKIVLLNEFYGCFDTLSAKMKIIWMIVCCIDSSASTKQIDCVGCTVLCVRSYT